VSQKLACVVEQVIAHGERVYTLVLRPERRVPRFRPGQFLHLAVDAYDPTGFWPESRAFSIASAPEERDAIRLTYAVHGRFTARLEQAAVAGRLPRASGSRNDPLRRRAVLVTLILQRRKAHAEIQHPKASERRTP